MKPDKLLKEKACRLPGGIISKVTLPRTSPYYVALAYATLDERDNAFRVA